MSNPTNEALFLIKDVKPGSKNLNIVFIVLEIGKFGNQFLVRAGFVSVFLKGPLCKCSLTSGGALLNHELV